MASANTFDSVRTVTNVKRMRSTIRQQRLPAILIFSVTGEHLHRVNLRQQEIVLNRSMISNAGVLDSESELAGAMVTVLMDTMSP